MKIQSDAQSLLAQIREYQNKIQENRIDNIRDSSADIASPSAQILQVI